MCVCLCIRVVMVCHVPAHVVYKHSLIRNSLCVCVYICVREKKVKGRVQELVAALERLTKSSEVRHQQSAEFVNDLKRANR